MSFVNFSHQSSLTLNDKHSSQHDHQIIPKLFMKWKYIFRFIYGIMVIVAYLSIQSYEENFNYQPSLFRQKLSFVILEKEPNVLTTFTGPNVPPVTVGLYYLPSGETSITRYRAIKENVHGTKDIFGYPIGAQLLSNESEYTIPSDRIGYPNGIREFKYFRELEQDKHIDARFIKPRYINLPDEERATILRNLFATWSHFTDEQHIPYWIAHGTLLGWWWGGSLFPWETDIDVQMNANFLYVLARFNGTVLSDRYLIDVNPNFKYRYSEQYNRVDARLIDKHTGYFIDISGMADIGARISSYPKKLLLCDKYMHKAFYSDLHPLVRIKFEGFSSWRPYETEKCLIKEYNKQALLQPIFNQYTFNLTNAKWIKNGRMK